MLVSWANCSVLDGTRDGSLVGEPIRRRPALPGPALPSRIAVRSSEPFGSLYVRVLDSTN